MSEAVLGALGEHQADVRHIDEEDWYAYDCVDDCDELGALRFVLVGVGVTWEHRKQMDELINKQHHVTSKKLPRMAVDSEIFQLSVYQGS